MPRQMKDSGVKWIGNVPKDWNIVPIKYLCSMQAGKTLSSEQISEEGVYPVYGGNGQRGFYTEYNTEGEYLLIGRQGALCGNVHLVEGRFWATEHALVTTPSNYSDIAFLYYLLVGMNLNQYVSSSADFAEYSQDPNWRLLHKEAYPNYEMPPLTQENAQRQLTQFMNDHNYGADDLDEYSQNPVWRELHKAAYPDYEMPEYDNSPEARELREMGIPNVDLRDCRPEYRGEVVDAVKDAISECPELKDQLTKVSCHEMSDGTYASYGPTQGNKKFGGCLNLN